jgi:hypothetical protein
MYEAIGVKNIDYILKKPQQPMPKDPSLEHIDALSGIPFQAFKGQDHRAHITAHLHFMATNMAKNNPMIGASLQKNVFEHISLMALEQVEMEFLNEIQQNTNVTTKSTSNAGPKNSTRDYASEYED